MAANGNDSNDDTDIYAHIWNEIINIPYWTVNVDLTTIPPDYHNPHTLGVVPQPAVPQSITPLPTLQPASTVITRIKPVPKSYHHFPIPS